ncbi:MAG: gingipain R, partial [Candidatus Cloacimonetes bacterium]|nr:gingipain R [Candidatus Cloacimonadota bacterium]
MIKRFLIIVFIMASIALNALTVDYQTPSPSLVSTETLPRMMTPGQPAMPYLPHRILIPQGERVTAVDIVMNNPVIFNHRSVPHALLQQPISSHDNIVTERDEKIYKTDAQFPPYKFRDLGTQRMNGHDIHLLNSYPYRYNPVKNTMVWFRSVRVIITTTSDESILRDEQKNLNTSKKTRDKLRRLVDNPEVIDTYTSSNSATTRNPHTFLVITSQSKASFFDNFIIWKNAQGIETGIALTNDIYANFSGTDNAAKVRNYIIDTYQNNASSAYPLEYVLLGGDDEIVPERGLWGQVGGTIDNGIPSDMYYSNLDGDFNANNNFVYGETDDNPDMLPEIAIGRIPAESELEFNRFFDKNYFYVDNNTFTNDQIWFIGENLNNNPLTWGGDYKDDILQYLPAGFKVDTLYDREDTFGSMAVQTAINDGLAIINHMGHSNENMVFGLTAGNIGSLNNTQFGLAYSQGCYPAAFDQDTSEDGESIAENLVKATGGLLAFVGNTRYGWYAPGSINGASQYFDREYFNALWQPATRKIGDSNNEQKIQLVNQALTYGVMRWCYYELIVFGDPTLEIKYPDGTYPYVTAIDFHLDDSIGGDGDNMANPGETVDL